VNYKRCTFTQDNANCDLSFKKYNQLLDHHQPQTFFSFTGIFRSKKLLTANITEL